MRGTYLFIGIVLILATISSIFIPIGGSVNVQAEEVPSYAKWGRLAVQETKSKYPDAKIVDYLHIGREANGNTTVEKFKLWLNEESREFGVFIHIEFDTETDEVINITFEETNQ
ncbi:YqzG/YhdC family protein [Oceanobacillus sp. CF4.6]|uniref:YqzG/YhdC family protein n=1 Tax=Oceanobacillus sp. CF4.6 TaxID=3373080 RepID=UPI003EE65C49